MRASYEEVRGLGEGGNSLSDGILQVELELAAGFADVEEGRVFEMSGADMLRGGEEGKRYRLVGKPDQNAREGPPVRKRQKMHPVGKKLQMRQRRGIVAATV